MENLTHSWPNKKFKMGLPLTMSKKYNIKTPACNFSLIMKTY